MISDRMIPNSIHAYYCLIGSCYYEDNKLIGKIIDIFDSGNVKTLRIKRENQKDLLYPFIEKFVKNERRKRE